MIDWNLFKPDKINKVGKQVLILGKKGCGKSFFTKALLQTLPRHVVFDVNKEYAGFKRYLPSNFDSESLTSEADLLLKKLIIPKMEMLDCLVFEEADMMLPNKQELTPQQRALVNLNRHWGITCVYITRRPALINTNIPALADYIIAFKLDDENDLDRIGKLHPEIVGAMHNVSAENHDFVFYDGKGVTVEKI